MTVSMIERLKDLSGSISVATTDAPDNYPQWRGLTYETHKADILGLWAQIRPCLKRDIDKIDWVDRKLAEAFSAYDAGDKPTGEQAMWDLYNSRLERLR